MTWDAQHGCTRKRPYLTKHEAKVANESLRSKEERHGRPPTHIYRCPSCRHYHLGHESWTSLP